MAIEVIPARLAASIPCGASSITAHCAGGSPSRSAPLRNTSGSGLPRVTSAPVITAANRSARSSFASVNATFSGGPDEPTPSRNPSAASASTNSTAPGMG